LAGLLGGALESLQHPLRRLLRRAPLAPVVLGRAHLLGEHAHLLLGARAGLGGLGGAGRGVLPARGLERLGDLAERGAERARARRLPGPLGPDAFELFERALPVAAPRRARGLAGGVGQRRAPLAALVVAGLAPGGRALRGRRRNGGLRDLAQLGGGVLQV